MKKQFLFLLISLNVSSQFFNPGKLSAQTAVSDTAAHLQPFVGKYQFTSNNMVLLLIILVDGHLVLRQLWDKQEIPFRQTAELEFYNDDHKFPLKFTKNAGGQITQLLAFNRDLWNRVADDYTPPMKNIIQLTGKELEAFDGKYELKGGDGDADDIAEVTDTGGHLVITHEKDVTNLFAISNLEFVTEDQSFNVVFTKNPEGVVTQAVVNEKDIWIKDK